MHLESNTDLGDLLGNLPGMAFRCLNDKELTIIYASRGSKSLIGYMPKDLIEKQAFRKIVHQDDQDRNKQALSRITAQSPRYCLVYRIRTSEGQDKWVKEEGIGIFSSTGRVKFIDGLLTDITDQKTVEIALQEENIRLKSSMGQRFRLEQLIGKSDAMQDVYDLILKLAEKDSSVIITGESGTGKELAAHAVHTLSARSQKRFVPVNCGAIPENLLEREFFGHKQGTFSGATSDKPGYLELAKGGTLFLDEVGEISLNFQTKLLRGLDGIGYTPIGGKELRQSDFRLISATNRDLSDLVRRGKMREDFFYRINVVPLTMPALRERQEDIPLLIDHFLKADVSSREPKEMPAFLRLQMQSYSWPGNVRELKNVIDRYLTLGKLHLPTVVAQDLEIHSLEKSIDGIQSLPQALDTYEHRLITTALEKCRWKKGETASLLGLSMRTLQRKLKKHAIK
ncbi:PAS domain S-box-containing protein [Desulfocicer vacuolatum DSM 3385]|uniref:PAS domain S-box-containing protein n=1 Tax=Desulfocicer vacuolatum DSM 3385 TaxID=1121400 RepID=A0A1W2DPU0_9BACT|nr:sigma 54-interacting transcriptional regulator [Desulfocicer vacuolatum]SMC99477.1 PAS domain S-box-containing protein [Desulfocicer vacuolatum DSM 3385]